MKSRSKDRTPTTVNLTVKRRYLTEREVERLMDCARKYGRYGHRDATMILVAYRHGLRASEVCDLQWQQIELSEGRLHVHRVKNGIPSVHPIRGDEMRALRKLRRDYPTDAHVFVSERGGPISPIGFHRLIQCVGEAAKMPFPIHPHMLRHACGFKLANDGHDTRALQHYLGHKNIQHTVRYTKMAPDRFGRISAPRRSRNRCAPRHACRRGDKSCDHVRGRPFLVLRTRGPIAVSASIISRFGLRFVGSSVASSAASGDGPLGAGSAAGSAVPSMTSAASPARFASMVWMSSMASSICSSLIALTPPLCSSFISRGTSNASILRYTAGWLRATFSIAFLPSWRKFSSSACMNSWFSK